MTALQRINPFDLLDDVAPDEELPGYEAATAPAYDSGLYHEPLITYSLRQYDRRIQMLVAYGPTTASSYRITTNSFRMFSKKPEMEVLYTSPECRQRNIASIAFDNNGPLPWRPRAHFDYTDPAGSTSTYNMESANFTDWAVELGDAVYMWRIDMRPISLVLSERSSHIVIARFTYSASGTSAARGAEVGELTIFRDSLTSGTDGLGKLVCALMVALTQLKKMGRHYTNTVTELNRSSSLSGEHMALRRTSTAAFSAV
ncbi:Nn.00g071190.m01.CDS01 [Neocucurbitaria sp. VM-36]